MPRRLGGSHRKVRQLLDVGAKPCRRRTRRTSRHSTCEELVTSTLRLCTVLAFVAAMAPRTDTTRSTRHSRDTLPPLAAFLVGDWNCAGGNPAGRVLNSSVAFAPTLGGRF